MPEIERPWPLMVNSCSRPNNHRVQTNPKLSIFPLFSLITSCCAFFAQNAQRFLLRNLNKIKLFFVYFLGKTRSANFVLRDFETKRATRGVGMEDHDDARCAEPRCAIACIAHG